MSRIVTVLAIALVAACTSGLPDAELYGDYVATYENGTETLTLQRGGTFAQEIRLNAIGAVLLNSGTWHVIRLSNRPDLVDLKNCLAVSDGFGRIRADFASRRGGCSFTVERRFQFAGQLRLGPDESSPLWKVD